MAAAPDSVVVTVIVAPTSFDTPQRIKSMSNFLRTHGDPVASYRVVMRDTDHPDDCKEDVDADERLLRRELRFVKNLKYLFGAPVLQKCAAPLLCIKMKELAARTQRIHGCTWNEFARDDDRGVDCGEIPTTKNDDLELPPSSAEDDMCAAFVGDYDTTWMRSPKSVQKTSPWMFFSPDPVAAPARALVF